MAGDNKPKRKWNTFFTKSTQRSAASPVSAPTMSLVPPALRMTSVNKDKEKEKEKEKENSQPDQGNPPLSSTNMARSPSANAAATMSSPSTSEQQRDPHLPGVGTTLNGPERTGSAPRLHAHFEQNKNTNINKKLTPRQQRHRDESVQATLESEYELERLARAGVDTRDFQTELDARVDAEARERMCNAESAVNGASSISSDLACNEEEAVKDPEQPTSSHDEERRSDWEAALRRRLQADRAAQRSRERERIAAIRAEQINRAMDTAQRQAQELARELAEDDYDQDLFEN